MMSAEGEEMKPSEKGDIVSTQPSAAGDTPRLWRHGLVTGVCARPKWCLLSFVAPCCVMGKNADQFGESCGLTAFLYWMGVGHGFGPLLRYKTRKANNIMGTITGDVLTHLCCPCCAALQQINEMEDLLVSEETPIINRS